MSGGTYDRNNLEAEFVDQVEFAKGPTIIGDGCRLGAKGVVMDGVTIGERAVVGAGAVVTKNLPDSVVAAGVPAKVLTVLTNSVKVYE